MCCCALGRWLRRERATEHDVGRRRGALRGSDRLQRLTDGAKRESGATIYTSAQTNDLGSVVDVFQTKYGVRVTVWRAGSEAVLTRAIQESRAGRHTVDVVETNGPELESLHREQILQQVKSLYQADLIAPAILPHGEWVGTRLNVFVQAYNTKLVKKEDLPKTWDDLRNPRWKGRLGIEQEDSDWLASISASSAKSAALTLPRDRREQWHLRAQRAHAADAAGGVGRGAAGPDRLQLQGRAAARAGRADRLVHDRQGDRAAERRGGRQTGATPLRGGPL